MDLRVLGKSGIEVNPMGLGLWAAGGSDWGPSDDDEILSVVDAALDAGINLFDTADVYGNGHSEDLLGRAIQGRRERFIVATKIGWKGFDRDQNRTQYDTVEKVVSAVEENLHRLRTDYIDVIQNHINFRDSTMEVVREGFQRLQEQGKVRAYGVSTSDFEYLQEFNSDGKCSTLQVDYSILNRTPEEDVLPYCQANGIGVLVRGPLAMGILADKFTPESTFAEGDFRRNWQTNEDEREVFFSDLQRVEELRLLAKGKSMAQLALQFALAHPAVTTVIPGARNLNQLTQNVQATQSPELTTEDQLAINRVIPPGGGRKIWPA
ncbi:MAG: aldo/keto reductase [Chloroflexota bacterium]